MNNTIINEQNIEIAIKPVMTHDNFILYIKEKISEIDKQITAYEFYMKRHNIFYYSLQIPQVILNALMTGSVLIELSPDNPDTTKNVVAIMGIANVVLQSISSTTKNAQKYQKYKENHWYVAFPNQKYQKYK